MKTQRQNFRSTVLQRDNNRCVVCGFAPTDLSELDAHHICDRNLMPFGGYVLPNGISLCTDRSPGSPDCHRKAESLHEKGIAIKGYTPAELYAKIKSSHWTAYFASLKENIDPRAISLTYQNFRKVNSEEMATCLVLGCRPNETTWELSCDAAGVSDPLILIYGKGRLYATDDGAEGCYKEDYWRAV